MSPRSLRNVRNRAHPDTRVVGDRVSPAMCWLVIGLMVLSSIRGIIVVNTNLDPGRVYLYVTALLLAVSGVGILISPSYSSLGLGRFKNLVHLNLILGILNLVIDHLVLGYPLSLGVGMVYVYAAPYILFVFMKIPIQYLRVGLAMVLVAIAYSVAENFYQLLSGVDGVQRVIDYNLKIHPNSNDFLSRGAGPTLYRVGGYTGSYHDSANILGMVVTFFFIRGLLKKNLLDLALALAGVISLTLTQSTANLVVFIFTVSVFTWYTLVRSRATMTFVYLTLSSVALAFLVLGSGGVMGFFVERLSGVGYWTGMFNQLDPDTLIRLLPFALAGHITSLGGIGDSGLTEVGLLRILYQLGTIHTAVLYSILLYPVWRWFKVRRWCATAVPAVAAIVFGFLSLLHYGSLFRVTSVFIFYAFGAICLSHVTNHQGVEHMERRSS